MPKVIYPIGFTLGHCICGYLGWSSDSIPINNLLLMFSGFCAGGIAVCIFEDIA